ncbi:MAG: hypothetical protein AAF985_11245 [Bacteroidota bacterium]
MRKTKLIALLQQLSTRERSRFREYVFSPFFNKNKKIQLLAQHLLDQAPEFPEEKLQKPVVFRLLFGAGKYQELKINNIISDLLQLLYDYLAHRQYETQKAMQKNLLLDDLLARGAYDHIERVARRYQQIQEKSHHQNYQFFHQQFELYNQLDRHHLSKATRTYDENLQLKNNALDLYYLSNKLRIACDMLSRNIVQKAGYECHFLDELLIIYEQNNFDFRQYPSVNIYYKILQMLQSENPERHYRDLKQLLDAHHARFPQEEARIIYVYLQNYCIQKINSGQSEYYKELQDLFKALLEQGILYMNGYLTQWDYKNIITIGLRLKDFGWTEKVIHQYKQHLLEEERNNAVAYNLAAFHYEKKEYKKALQELHNVEFTDTSYHLGTKIIQIKSYYELDESEALYALIEAFQKYILRNRDLAEYRKKANAHFLRLTKKIYQLKISKQHLSTSAFNKKQRVLREQLDRLHPLANKGWLEMIYEKL